MAKCVPSLPSFKSEFTASVPLTRIRDIAHRNDIPRDLKQIATELMLVAERFDYNRVNAYKGH
jgi:hypothetical protein